MIDMFDFDELYGAEEIEINFDSDTGEFSISGIAEKDKLLYKMLSLYSNLENENAEEEKTPQEKFLKECLNNQLKGYKVDFNDDTVYNYESLRDLSAKIMFKENPSKKEAFLLYSFMGMSLSEKQDKILNMIFGQAAGKAGYKLSIINRTGREDFPLVVFLERDDGIFDVVFFNLIK